MPVLIQQEDIHMCIKNVWTVTFVGLGLVRQVFNHYLSLTFVPLQTHKFHSLHPCPYAHPLIGFVCDF